MFDKKMMKEDRIEIETMLRISISSWKEFTSGCLPGKLRKQTVKSYVTSTERGNCAGDNGR